MKKQEAINLVKNTFSEKFDENNFKKFITNLLKDHKHLNTIREGQYIKDSFKSFIKKSKTIGSFEDSEGNSIDILLVALTKESSLERARTVQRNFISDYLKRDNKTSALVAFISPNENDWRFSFVKLEYSLEIKEGKIKTNEEVTPAKRYSFLVGENEGSHTVKSRFISLLENDKKPNLKEIENAFSIEVVTKEFFNNYCELFHKLNESLVKIVENDQKLKHDFKDKEILISNFSKKTLGQIVFLYFLQKKGWFGVKAEEEWGTGDKNFMVNLFKDRNKYSGYKGSFFNDILEPLFYEGLSTDNGEDSIYNHLSIGAQKYRMPFLNGGLFSPMNNYSWKTTEINLLDSLFYNEKLLKNGDIGDGILNVFNRYNFTVNENEPLEKEVAVDPEMLGKVFENLLDIKDRKSKGAFYTPREIVHYMCQECLINYIYSELNEGIDREELDFFIKSGNQIIQNDKVTLQKHKEKEIKGYEYTGTYKFLLSENIRGKSEEIDNLLANIKVCDPAVGSGAFPLGMLNEIVKARQVLNIFLEKKYSIYDLKLHTISHSIYGVDLDSGAVEIAKLRFWLSLVVDDDEPHPLPNLEYKIMQGNSLISNYEGIKLFDESLLEDKSYKEIIKLKTKKTKNQEKASKYLKEHGATQLFFEEQKKIDKEIKKIDKEIKILEKEELIKSQASLFDKREKAKEKTRELENKISQFISESGKSKKQKLKREIDELKWDLIELTLTEQKQEDKLIEIKILRRRNIKPFFIWKLEFSEVFKENGGFDVVIGNPPYVQLQKNGGFLANQLEKSGYETFVRSGDIYALFYELGNQLLQQQGYLAFITSNKWMRAGYGEKLRNYFATKTTPKLLIDLGSGVFETATVDTNILLFQKNKIDTFSCVACDIKIDLIQKNINLENYIQENKIELTNFNSESWVILNSLEQKIKNKIENIGIPLKDWDIKINRGVLTGFNEAFIIDGKKKDNLIIQDPKSIEIIKPILRGKDIKKYSSDFSDKWLIATLPAMKLNIEDYIEIKKYLETFGQKLEQTGQKYIDQNGIKQKSRKKTCNKWFETQDQINYFKEFEKDKIVYSEIVREPQFFYDEKKYFPEATSFLMTGDNLKYIVSILNSKAFTYFFSRFYAGGGLGDRGYRYKKKFLELTPIPKISFEDQKPFIDLVDKILYLTSQKNYDTKNPLLEQRELEEKIDEMVFDLYELTEEERKFVLEEINYKNNIK